jgi:hypothetical protein
MVTGLYFMTKALTMAEQNGGSGGRQQVQRVDRAFLGRLGHHGRHFLDQIVQARHGEGGANRLLSQALTGGRPQMNTNTERMIQGVQAAISALLLCLATAGAA